MNKNQFAIKTLVPDEVYTDRKEFLDLFYEEALKAATRRSMSIVLLGQRRMGKTEIFKRVINRLFFKQDHKDPNAVVPVYYKFSDNITDPWKFAIEYVENFIKWYVGFRLGDPGLITKKIDIHNLVSHVRENIEVTEGFAQALNIIEIFYNKGLVYPEKDAVNIPRLVSDLDDSTIVMFLDEIQNIHLPQHDFSIVGYMQDAVESPTCPHFITGSAMTILHEILGKGSLHGRFDAESIKPFTDFYGAELVGKSSVYYKAEIPELMRPVISEKCGGNPFYINAMVRRSARLSEPLNNEEAINRILAIDLSSGFIYQELRDQVIKWIDRLNDHNITKWILYLASLEEKERIDPERIQRELKKQEGKDVEIKKINEVMIKLSQGDLIEYKSYGDWFTHVNDPILQEFLKTWGKIEVAGEKQTHVIEEVVLKYESLNRKYKNYQGYLAEIFMIQVLWNNQKKTVEGKYFNYPEAIKVPHFIYIEQRVRLGSGKGKEIDIYASAGRNVWIAESKWWKDPVGEKVVENLIRQGDHVKKRRGKDLENLTLWLFASNGVTENAKKMMEENDILWSTKEDLNNLLVSSSLRKLPDIDG
ncbi:ATPase domain protein, prokaryote domain protein [Candidatus Magnetomorum sp. HK-1]|nr:ATPase domain protein, prokaryote domain protein [Candidatus Magnetomorum sp. HK-1]